MPGLVQPTQAMRVGNGHAYKPKRVLEAEGRIRRAMRQEMRRLGIDEPYLGPVRAGFVFCFRLAGVAARARKEGLPYDVLQTPDDDNLSKLVRDSLMGAHGIYLDDCQVTGMATRKVFRPWSGTAIFLDLEEPRNPYQLEARLKSLEAAREVLWDLKATANRDTRKAWRDLLEEERRDFDIAALNAVE
jgi:Holliday junction resolvase RusA-like endonuclease